MESHGLWTSKRFPELTWKVLFVGEALVGNDAIDQAEQSRERSLLWLVCFHELYIFHFSIIFFCKNQSRHHPFQLLYLPEFSRWCYNKQRRSRPALRQLSLWQVTKFNRSLVDLSADPRCGPPWYRCSTQRCNNISIILGVPSFSPNCVWAASSHHSFLGHIECLVGFHICWELITIWQEPSRNWRDVVNEVRHGRWQGITSWHELPCCHNGISGIWLLGIPGMSSLVKVGAALSMVYVTGWGLRCCAVLSFVVHVPRSACCFCWHGAEVRCGRHVEDATVTSCNGWALAGTHTCARCKQRR